MERYAIFVAIFLMASACKSKEKVAPTDSTTTTPTSAATAATSTAVPARTVAVAETPGEGPLPGFVRPESNEAIEKWLIEEDVQPIVTTFSWCSFQRGGSLECLVGAEGGKTGGSWSVENGHVKGTVDDERGSFDWDSEGVTTDLFAYKYVPEGHTSPSRASFYCGRHDGKRKCRDSFASIVGIRHAGVSERDFARLRPKLEKMRPTYQETEAAWEGLLAVDDTTQAEFDATTIWYRKDDDDARKAAERVAELFASELGKIEMAPEFHMGPFDVFLWVAKSATLRVSVMDGHCTTADCSNPLVAELLTAAEGEGRTVKDAGRAKTPRQSTELWFVGTHERTAEALRGGPLKNHVPAPPKKWEWGGDFDVLIVAGPPPAK